MKKLRLLICTLLTISIVASFGSSGYADSDSDRFAYNSYAHVDPSLVVHDISLSQLWVTAEAELQEQCIEQPRGSGRIKYNTWFYGSPVGNQMEGTEYIDQYNWNVAFVCYCADQLGYIDAGDMIKTADGGELLTWLISSDALVYTKGRAVSQTNPVVVCPGDLIFLPYEDLGLCVGIVTESESNSIRYIMGDTNDTVEALSIDISDLPESACFARLLLSLSDKEIVYLFLKQELGLNDAAATGVYANLYMESHLNHGSIGDEGTSFGIAQWHNGRWTSLVNFCNSNLYEWDSLDGQLRFLQYELETKYPELLLRLRNTPDNANGAYAAAYDFCTRYERPAAIEEASVFRGEYALQVYGSAKTGV